MTSTEPTIASARGTGPDGDDSIVRKLSTLDRWLAVWILLAMAVGLGLGRLVPGMNDALAKMEIGGISLPIALG
ncbi:arsenical-resistance protein, partial [Streptomyces sp. SID7499]|nr:arsenical-resistance protein [Streptomyces sp. SID7499]